MAGWERKRFWSSARIASAGDGYAILLDGRATRTPAGARLIAPTRALAGRIAGEWEAQWKVVDPSSMPVTRCANAAIDKVRPRLHETVAAIAKYGESDLLCYRAREPEELIQRQAAEWDPLLDWGATALGARLIPTQGVMFQPQPPESLAALRKRISGMSDFQLAAFHELVGISGSLILAFAVTHGHLDPESAWRASSVDEDWQAERWGEDMEASLASASKQAAFALAAEIFDLSGRARGKPPPRPVRRNSGRRRKN